MKSWSSLHTIYSRLFACNSFWLKKLLWDWFDFLSKKKGNFSVTQIKSKTNNQRITSRKYLNLNIIYASDCEISTLFLLFWWFLFPTKKFWKLDSRLQYFQGIDMNWGRCQQLPTIFGVVLDPPRHPERQKAI